MDRLDAMTAFVKVAEAGSFSAAARALEISLASVSRQVAALEQHLGSRLVQRTTRRLALTDGGREFYERARRILGEIGEAEQALSSAATVPSGRLHVSAPGLIGRLHLAPLLPGFLARYAAVSVDLTLVDRPVDLIEEGIDVALRIGALEDQSMLVRKLGSVHLVVCAAPAYLARRGAPRRPEDLADHDCLVFAAVPEGADWHFQLGARQLALRVPARLKANTLDPLVDAALAGAGLMRVPCWQVAEHIGQGRLVRVLGDYERPAAPIHALFPPGRPLPAKVRAFADYLVAGWAPPPFDCSAVIPEGRAAVVASMPAAS
jgi:DNA-binding transcriptional LysR family regulator